MCFVVLTLFQVYSVCVCVWLDVGPDNSTPVLHFTELTFCTFGKSKSRINEKKSSKEYETMTMLIMAYVGTG